MELNLKEARKLVAGYREDRAIEPAVIFTLGAEAAIVLDDRITELEAQRDDLKAIVIELGGVGALPIYK